MDFKAQSLMRLRIQSATLALVVIVIIGGQKYPLLGFFVPAVMLMGIVGGFFRGRFVCGWLCPRGAFLDRAMKLISPIKKIPDFFRNSAFRWSVFALLMGFTAFKISLNPSDPYHWGTVFVRICMITTGIGVILALLIHPRAWCSFCPIGTVQSVSGGTKGRLKMDDGCTECRICEKVCPMNLQIIDDIKDGKLNNNDCLRCPECGLACPQNILHY